jgi:hypothetical protein
MTVNFWVSGRRGNEKGLERKFKVRPESIKPTPQALMREMSQ